MEDIGKELYEKIAAEFERTTGSDSVISGILKRISKGTAQPTDIALYAQRLGLRLRKAIESHVSADVLPNGQMYYNIAEKILRPSLSTNYELFNAVAQQIQTAVDQKQGIRIKAQRAEFPEDRIDTVISAAAEPGIPEKTMLRRMSAPAETITQSYADDYVRANAEFRSRAGFEEYIIRRDDGDCCEWCAKLAGKYRYPDQVPEDVWHRHDNCGCTVEHVSGGMSTNVHSKRQTALTKEQQESIRQTELKKPTVLSPEEGKKIEAEQLAKRKERLTGGGESGIIKPKIIINMQYFGSTPIPIILPKKEYGKIIHEINTLYYDKYIYHRVFWHISVIDDKYYQYRVINNGFNDYVIVSKVRLDE